jgi:hypothetical protein
VFTHDPKHFKHYKKLEAVLDEARSAGSKFKIIAPTSEGVAVVVDLMLASDLHEPGGGER